IHHLAPPTAVEALKGRIAALERSAAELQALRDADAVPGDRSALDYLLATTAEQLDWLTGFVESMNGSRTADGVARCPPLLSISKPRRLSGRTVHGPRCGP